MPDKNKIKDMIGKSIERTLTLERADSSVDTENRTVKLCFSTDTPIQHWFSYIILDHKKSAVRTERILSAGPVLENHDHNKHRGVVESVEIDEKDGKGRATVKLSRSKEGEDLLNDIEDGIKRNISVGFVIHDLEPKLDDEGNQETIGNELVYMATDWEPFEISFASLPRDIAAGVGRSLEDEPNEKESILEKTAERDVPAEETERRNMSKEKQPTPDTPAETPPTAAAIVSPEQREIERNQEFIQFGKDFGAEELARDLALDPDKTLKDLRKAIVEKRAADQKKVAPKPVELTPSEQKRYSITRAIIADASHRPGYKGEKIDDCFEREVSDEIEKGLRALEKTPELRGGILVPGNLRMQAPELEKRSLEVKTANKGEELVFEDFGGFIEMLRKRAKVVMLGARMLSGLTGDLSMPRQTAAATASWGAESPGSDTSESELSLDDVQMSPKELRAATSFTRKLLQQSSVSIDQLVMEDLLAINRLEIDRAAIHGSGASNEPTGIYSQTGVNSVPMGGVITFDKVVDMETEVAADNADVENMAYLTTSQIRGAAKKTEQFSGTNGTPLWQGGEMNGFRAEASNQVASDLGVGNDEHGIVFGDWNQLLIGEWGTFELLTDPYTLAGRSKIKVWTYLFADIAVRHPDAFSIGTGLTLV